MSAVVDEKHSSSSSSSANNVPAGKNPNAMTYDERRRAALREVDEAKFSYVLGITHNLSFWANEFISPDGFT
jgi:hypothetical protein